MSDLREVRIRTNCASCVNKCCSQPYNWVYLTREEIAALTEASGRPPSEFVAIRQNPASGLTLQTLNLPCQFLGTDGSCTVYDRRPLICRLFPFYPDPLVGAATLLPIECGDRLEFLDPESREGWSVEDHEVTLREWIAAIWREARG